ncbi:glycosyltransferase family 4 protein [Candidatus Ruminimicrobiellum ovillum]|uniref:glycosyltransferase family 4 protein n=1 Tax=Candidatus Ruminimicrobiellum ovillum TaxID=1947927 RepID=UPI003559EA09
MNNEILYLITFITAFFTALILTPFFRHIARMFNIYDRPLTAVKTHKVSTPYLGGLAIWSGWVISLLLIRLITNFPTGTLNNLRSVIIGSSMLLLLGLCDDIKKGGLGFKFKFLVQIIACLIVVYFFDIRINFIENKTLSVIISIFWIIGLSNAFNLIDIMDGLSCGTAAIASFFFFIIALPSEMIYVNFCAVALLAACLGFLPFNLSKSKKIFMGDTGSLSIGFILATVAMGTSYTKINPIGIFAPLIILAVPIYETIFVSIMRILKGKNPFLGSKDHFPLRLEKMGYSRKQILLFVYILSFIFGIFSYTIVKIDDNISYLIFSFIILLLVVFSVRLSKVKVD